ncbi:putative membrane protein [Synechococcus sp. A18-40]|nr:putative membrane protein [Synechococcus sp. A18-40]
MLLAIPLAHAIAIAALAHAIAIAALAHAIPLGLAIPLWLVT